MGVNLARDLDGRREGLSALVPGSGADLAWVFANELEGFRLPEDLARTPADVVRNDVRRSQYAVGINDEGRALGNAGILLVYPEFPRETAIVVRGHGILKPFDKLFGIEPALMRVDGVCGNAHDLGAEGGELIGARMHIRELGWADKGEVLRVPEENQPLANEIRILDMPNLVLRGEIRLKGKIGKWLVNFEHESEKLGSEEYGEHKDIESM